jgi:hypothetical protein
MNSELAKIYFCASVEGSVEDTVVVVVSETMGEAGLKYGVEHEWQSKYRPNIRIWTAFVYRLNSICLAAQARLTHKANGISPNPRGKAKLS